MDDRTFISANVGMVSSFSVVIKFQGSGDEVGAWMVDFRGLALS